MSYLIDRQVQRTQMPEPLCQALTVSGRRCAGSVVYVALDEDTGRLGFLCAAHGGREVLGRELELVKETLDYRMLPTELVRTIHQLFVECARRGLMCGMCHRRLTETLSTLGSILEARHIETRTRKAKKARYGTLSYE